MLGRRKRSLTQAHLFPTLAFLPSLPEYFFPSITFFASVQKILKKAFKVNSIVKLPCIFCPPAPGSRNKGCGVERRRGVNWLRLPTLLRPNPPGATLPKCWITTTTLSACHTMSWLWEHIDGKPRARKQVMPWTNFLGGSITRLTNSVRRGGMPISSDVTQYEV